MDRTGRHTQRLTMNDTESLKKSPSGFAQVRRAGVGDLYRLPGHKIPRQAKDDLGAYARPSCGGMCIEAGVM